MQTKQSNGLTGAASFFQRSRPLKTYDRFGEVTRYLTVEELQNLFDSIDNCYHRLMFEVIYERGCRVGEFMRIQVKHLNFNRSTVFFPAENATTKYVRTSYLPKGLMSEVRSMLKQGCSRSTERILVAGT